VAQYQSNVVVEHILGWKCRKAVHALYFRVQKLRHVP
jgi:hypothetical protein